jgi:hypothetical protein
MIGAFASKTLGMSPMVPDFVDDSRRLTALR